MTHNFFRPQPEVGAAAQHARDLRRWESYEEQRAAERAADEARREAEREERAAKVAAWKAQDEQEAKEASARREADRLERVRADEVVLKQQMRETFLRQPGSTPETFEREWPAMLRQYQVQQTLAAPMNMVELTIQEMRESRRFSSASDFGMLPGPVAEMVEVE